MLLGKWPAVPGPVEEGRRQRFIDLLTSRVPLPPSVLELAPTENDRGRGVGAAEVLWYFPAYAGIKEKTPLAERIPGWLPGPDSVRTSDAHLRGLAAAAEARMRRPFHLAATHEVGIRLESLARESGLRQERLPGARETAMQVGTAVHRLFETWRLDAEPRAEMTRQRECVRAYLRASVAEELHADAFERAEELLARIEAGELLGRFLGLRERIVARELPVALPPEPEGEGPVGFLSGAVDLVYRTDDGHLVIVDYKTDALTLDLEIDTRATEYAAQEAVYAEALRSALGLDEPPACELWFLWPDRLHRIGAATP